MTARAWFVLLGAAVLLGVTVALQATGNPWAAAPVWVFWGAVVVALVVRVVRARSLRQALRPAGQGIDEGGTVTLEPALDDRPPDVVR